MGRKSFIIVGSGWRAAYYIRIARALPEEFDLMAVLCRSQEKADKIKAEYDVNVSVSPEECKNMNPDFVVVAVNKQSISQVSREWMDMGFTVLCETPAAVTLKECNELWEFCKLSKGRLVVAEQYHRYPTISSMLDILSRNIIGEPYSAVVSMAHDYHGASLIRRILRKGSQDFTVTARTYSYPTAETMSRYEEFHDGREALKKRDVAIFEYEDGKTAFMISIQSSTGRP